MDNQDRDYDGPKRDESAPYGGATKTDIPAIGITLQYPLDEGVGRGLVFQTFVAADCAPSELNTALDKVRKAADRQRAIVSLPTFRGLLEDREAALKREVSTHFGIETERDQRNANRPVDELRRKPRPNAQEVQDDARTNQALASSKAKIEQTQQDIAIAKRRIADAEALIAAGE